MKLYKIIFSVLITLIVAWSCKDTVEVTPEIPAPSGVKANLTIATDGSGLVKGTPSAEGASKFEILFGDTTNETPTVIDAGKSFEHTYKPGDYTLKLTAIGMTGLKTQATEAVKIVAVERPLALPIDFEDAQVKYEFSDFGGATNTVVDNPQKAGINTSNKVARSNKGTGSEVWAGSLLTLPKPIDFSSKKGFKMMVWSPKPNIIVKLKVENLTDGNIAKEVDVKTTKTNEWEELSYGFADIDVSKTYQKVVVFFDFGTAGANTNFYFDNIVQADPPIIVAPPAAAPTTLAPKPTLAEANVISLFSRAYANVAVDTWRTDWSAADYAEVTIAGEKVKRYSKLNFVGIETVKSQINATGMTHFHTDFWTGDATEFKIKLVDFGANGAFAGGDDVEHEIAFTGFEKNKWISLDIPLTDFKGLTTRGHIAQLIYVGAPTGTNTIFIDNIYFHK